ncbi:MAG: hypothetical protein NVS2B17_05340 [Candidatus Velthaea sp.]
MMKRLAMALALASLTTAAASAQATSLTGKVVDLATYVTRDHNMDAMHGSMKGDAMKGDAMKGDAMKGDAMKGDAMKGDAMKGDAMHESACPEVLGLATTSGKTYVLATQMGSSKRADLCKAIGKTTTLNGKSYSQGGTTVFLVGK